MRVLSIQSSVCYGYVGNAAAVFALQRLGHEVWPVPTVLFSSHTGYAGWRGRVCPPAEVAALVDGLADLGVLAEVDVVLTGYLGSAEVGEVALEAVSRVRTAHPGATYVCDPVLGNARAGVFVGEGIAALLGERVLPAADVVTPNLFELGLLTATEPRTTADILAAAGAVLARGPSVVLVTSVDRAAQPPGTIEMLAVSAAGAWLTRTPRLPLPGNGAGDLTAALFSAHLHETGDPAAALARTTSSVYAVLRATLDSGDRELRLVAAQDALAHPGSEFPAERVG